LTDVAEKLWDIANLITGFAVAQVLATTFALAKGEIKALKGPMAHWLALGSTLLFASMYLTAIIWCGYKTIDIEPDRHGILLRVAWGRAVAVITVNLALLLALYGHRRGEQIIEETKKHPARLGR